MPDRHGPYRRLRFLLEIDGVAKAGFSRCQVPENRTQVVEYREGTDPPTMRKLWGLSTPTPLVLESGVTDDSVELFEWRQSVQRGDVDEARGPIAVVILDEEGNPGPRWELRNAWPARYEGPTLDASTSDAAIERLVVVHEGMRRVPVADDESSDETDEAPPEPDEPDDSTTDETADGDDEPADGVPTKGWPTGPRRIPTDKRIGPYAKPKAHEPTEPTESDDSTTDGGGNGKLRREKDPRSIRSRTDTDDESETTK